MNDREIMELKLKHKIESQKQFTVGKSIGYDTKSDEIIDDLILDLNGTIVEKIINHFVEKKLNEWVRTLEINQG